MSDILEDIVSEGERLLGIAEQEGVPLRLLGGVAVRLKTEAGVALRTSCSTSCS